MSKISLFVIVEPANRVQFKSADIWSIIGKTKCCFITSKAWAFTISVEINSRVRTCFTAVVNRGVGILEIISLEMSTHRIVSSAAGCWSLGLAIVSVVFADPSLEPRVP